MELKAKTAQKGRLHFSVRDTGVGIPTDKVDLIFEPFRQADSSTTRKFGGTGLGLTISSRLVNMMGGHLWVESVLGKGSLFHFTVALECNPEGKPPAVSDDLVRELSSTQETAAGEKATLSSRSA